MHRASYAGESRFSPTLHMLRSPHLIGDFSTTGDDMTNSFMLSRPLTKADARAWALEPIHSAPHLHSAAPLSRPPLLVILLVLSYRSMSEACAALLRFVYDGDAFVSSGHVLARLAHPSAMVAR